MQYANLTLCIESTCKSLFETNNGKQPFIVFRRGGICESVYFYIETCKSLIRENDHLLYSDEV